MEKVISFFLFLFLVAFPFGQLTRLPLSLVGFPEVHVYLTDVFLVGLLGSWGIRAIREKRYRLPSLAIPIFSFTSFCLLSLVAASFRLLPRELMVSGLYLVRWIAYSGLYFALADLKKHYRWLGRVKLLNFLVGLGISVAVFGLIQLVFWPNLRPMESWGWDPHFYRLVGTFFDPGFTGIILVLALILIVASFGRKGRLGVLGSAGWRIGGLGIVFLSLALTYSRASFLAYLIGMGVLAWVKKKSKLFLGAVLLGALTLIFLPQPAGEGGKISRTYTIEARVKNWQQALQISQDHLLLGVGFNAYRYAQQDYGFLEKYQWQESHSGGGADSSLLFVLATTGVVGLLGYLGIWIETVKRGKKGLFLASLAAVLVHSWFLNSLFYPWVMAWIWILLAYGE